MGVILEAGVRYDMPTAFGPSPAADDEEGYMLHGATVSFVTDRAAAEPFMPPGCEPAPHPVVAISYQKCSKLDWMGGRDYNLVSVYISAIYRRNGRSLTAPLSLVIWETDCAPIIAGREFMGTPKLFGQIPDTDVTASAFEFQCSEYGAPLVSASCSEMRPVSAEQLASISKSGRNIVRMHWKYIPAPGGGADANYPIAMYASSEYSQIWKGSSNFQFGRPSHREAPYSSKITALLAELPVIEMRPATAVVASRVTLHRSKTTRLDIEGGPSGFDPFD